MSIQIKSRDRAAQTSMSILHFLLNDHHPRDYAYRLWDGSVWEAETGQPTRFTMVLQHPGALRATDETTYRVWRLFTSAAAHGFEIGETNVYQSLVIKPDGYRSGLPLTRAEWYKLDLLCVFVNTKKVGQVAGVF